MVGGISLIWAIPTKAMSLLDESLAISSGAGHEAPDGASAVPEGDSRGVGDTQCAGLSAAFAVRSAQITGPYSQRFSITKRDPK